MKFSFVKHLGQGPTRSYCSINGNFSSFQSHLLAPAMPRMMPDAVLGQAVNTKSVVSMEMWSAGWENPGDGWATLVWCSGLEAFQAAFDGNFNEMDEFLFHQVHDTFEIHLFFLLITLFFLHSLLFCVNFRCTA